MNQPQMFQKLGLKAKFTSSLKNEPPPAVEGGIFATINLGQNFSLEEALPPLPTREELEMSIEARRIAREVEDYVKSRRIAFEEKMFEKFYLMRIEQSRKFIDLIRKINKSWEDFVDYLKSIGSQGASGDGDCTVYSLTNSSSLTALSQVTDQ